MIGSFRSLLTAINRSKSPETPIPPDPFHARALHKGSLGVEWDDIVDGLRQARTALSLFR